jgi:hypothetical protein
MIIKRLCFAVTTLAVFAAMTVGQGLTTTTAENRVPIVQTAIKLPDTQNASLKQIQEQQDKLVQAFQALDSQKVIVAQRAALELGMTAKQLDTMELAVDGGNFVFRPRKIESAKKE